MKTPITYYGGKQTLSSRLLALLPNHRLYCEPFFGGGALFFSKPSSNTEVINDINGEVVNFYKVCKLQFRELQKLVQATPHSRQVFYDARVVNEHPALFDEVKRAWAFWVLTNQGFAGQTTSWGFGRTNSKEKSLANKRDQFTKEYADRLDQVQIENKNAIDVIQRCDCKDAFFYLDPPYINTHQGHYSGYSKQDYEMLLVTLTKVKGKFLLSSYPSTILNKYIKTAGWQKQKLEKAIAVTKHTKRKKTELFVFNYSPSEAGTYMASQDTSSLPQITENLKNLNL